jgi:hypothetical protein
MSFARKAVQWDQEDVKAAAALLKRLDWDSSAAQSLLIFVNEFRCLIEGAESPTEEGTSNADAVKEAL